MRDPKKPNAGVTPANSNTRVGTGRLLAVGPRPRAEVRAAPAPANSNTRMATGLFVKPVPRAVTPVAASSDFASAGLRERMVERLRAEGIRDEPVLAAMLQTPRHAFVDEALASRAYENAALPIGVGQTISQPRIVAHMIATARNGRELGRVLEVGAGCGYQAAVLAHLAREVYSIERIRTLYEAARRRLAALRLARVRLIHGDGMLGLESAAPFDAIIVAAAGLAVPQALLDQLAVGGRLVAPEGGAQQRLVLIERITPDRWKRTELETVRFVPLQTGIQ